MADFKLVVDANGRQQLIPLTPEEVAQQTVDATEHSTRVTTTNAERARISDIRTNASALLTTLRTSNAAAIDTFVDNNVNSLADAKTVLKAVIKVVALLARGQ